MRPKFLTGDFVEVRSFGSFNEFTPAMVISVNQANQMPDALARGMFNAYAWSYWVIYPGGRIEGPLLSSQIHDVR